MIFASKKIGLLIWVFTLSLSAHAEQLTFTTGDWRPYIYETDGTVDPQTPGFSIEIVNAVFAKMGHNITYVTEPFLRQIMDVERGKYTALAGVYREEAPKLIFPQEPIGMTRNCFYTKTGSNWQYKDPDSLLTAKIAVVGGYTYGEIDSQFEAIPEQITKLTGDEENMMWRLTKMVDSGRVTAFIQDIAVTEHYFKSERIQGRYKTAGCLETIPSMIGFSPNDLRSTDFVKAFDLRIKELRDSGKLEQILTKYGISDWQ